MGEWRNCSVYFDTLGKKKINNRPVITPDDPQDGDPRADPKEQQSKVPQFGASDNKDRAAGFTTYFENKQIVNNRERTMSKKEPQMNGDMHLQVDPLAQGRPALDKSVPQQEARSKVPQFSVWEGEGEADYDQCFENVGKKNKNGKMLTPKPSDAHQLNSDDCEASDPSDKDNCSESGEDKESFKMASLRLPSEVLLCKDSFRESREDKEPFNMARFPLFDEVQIDESVWRLAKADDQQDYGGGRRSTTEQRGCNDAVQIGITTQGFPVYTTGSETLLWKEYKLMQPNVRTSPENEAQMNQDLHPPAQEVLQFGEGRGEVGYTQSFVNVRKIIDDGRIVIPEPSSDASQMNCDVSEPPTDETSQFSSFNQVRQKMNGDMHLHEDHSALDPPALAKSEARSKVVLQFGVWEGEGEAGYSRWFGNVWMKIKNWVVTIFKSLVNYCLGQNYEQFTLQSGCLDDGNREEGWTELCSGASFVELSEGPPMNYARSPLLDEDSIAAERGRPLPMYYGGGRRLTVEQSDKKNVGQTEIASRGFPNPATGSTTTPLQTESNLIQSNIEVTSRPVSNNDTPASCHHKQEKKVGSIFSWFKRGRKKTTKQGRARDR